MSLKILGCVIGDNYDIYRCWFKHPVNSIKAYYIPDACHMLKLARNVLGNNNLLQSNSGLVKWFYIEESFEGQSNLTSKLANKLCKIHIHWKNNVIKVK